MIDDNSRLDCSDMDAATNDNLRRQLTAATDRAETLARQSKSLNRELALVHKSLHEQLETIQAQERELAAARDLQAVFASSQFDAMHRHLFAANKRADKADEALRIQIREYECVENNHAMREADLTRERDAARAACAGWTEAMDAVVSAGGLTGPTRRHLLPLYRANPGQPILDELTALRAMKARLEDDGLAEKIATNCHDPEHDDRWCPTCEASIDAIEAYRSAVLGKEADGLKSAD